MKKGTLLLITVCMFIGLIFCAGYAQEDGDTMRFKEMLRARILEVLDSWPAEDQYAIMFFIYPNEAYACRGYANIPEFTMLYRCESDLESRHNPFFRAVDEFENRWNPAFWEYDLRTSVIDYYEPNACADALIDWYEATKVQNIGYEDLDAMYDSDLMYIGRGPNGLPELLEVIVEIARELQTDGTIENKFGRKIPIIMADFGFTWYMIKATQDANPNGEAEAYIDACIRKGYISVEQIES